MIESIDKKIWSINHVGSDPYNKRAKLAVIREKLKHVYENGPLFPGGTS